MYKYIKSALDRVCAALGLIVLAIPLLLIALAIRCESRGKAIFKQVRTGLNGKEFYVYKFRTMWRTDVPFDKDNPVIEDDNAELTPAGKILRKLKIDEFPQLINVLRGEMSLIGPRPFMPVYYEQYADWEKERLRVKSEERSYYDIYYARHLSFFTDVKIMFKTVGVLLLGEKKFLKPVSVADMEKMKGGESAERAA